MHCDSFIAPPRTGTTVGLLQQLVPAMEDSVTVRSFSVDLRPHRETVRLGTYNNIQVYDFNTELRSCVTVEVAVLGSRPADN